MFAEVLGCPCTCQAAAGPIHGSAHSSTYGWRGIVCRLISLQMRLESHAVLDVRQYM
jgi:hypothetical protein